MLRRGEKLLGRALLNDVTALHHGNARADATHDLQIVRDEQHRDAALPIQTAQKREDLRLHGHVERGGRLVEQQQMRIGDDGCGDHHALELTAGALVRVLAVNFLRRGEVHIAQRLERTRAALLLRQLRVDSQRLLDLRADAHERVHRGHRLLKDNAELAALDGA